MSNEQGPILYHRDSTQNGPDRGVFGYVHLLLTIKGLAAPEWRPWPVNIGWSYEASNEEFVLADTTKAVVGPLAFALWLESYRPEPTLFPNGNRGMPLALIYWARHVRRIVVSGCDADAHLALVTRQLADGRPWLQGGHPGLADAAAALVVGFVGLPSAPKVGSTADLSLLGAWWRRVEDFYANASATDAWLREPLACPGDEPALLHRITGFSAGGRFHIWKTRSG